MVGKAPVQRLDDGAGVVDRQSGLGHIGQAVGIGDRQAVDFLDGRHQPAGPLEPAQRAFHLGMSGVADQNDFAALSWHNSRHHCGPAAPAGMWRR